MRESAQHGFAHRHGQVRRCNTRITHAPAEQHAVIVGDAKVIQYKIIVTDRNAIFNQTVCQIMRQLLGGNDVCADRHDAFGDFGCELLNIDIARQYHKIRFDLPVRGFHHGWIGVLNLGDDAVLKNRHARFQTRPRQAQSIFEGM